MCDQQVLWKVTFEIPTRYSERTMLALKEKQLNSLTRNEIVQGISAKIFNHCMQIPNKITGNPICH